MTPLDFAPVSNKPEFLAAFQFVQDAIHPNEPKAASFEGPAGETFQLWRAATALLDDATLMLARSAGRLSVASKQGGVIIEAKEGLNVGLLRGVLKRFEAVEACKGGVDPATIEAGSQAIWSLANRLDRVETPRMFTLKVGETQYVLHAQKGKFDVVAADLAQFKNDLHVKDQKIKLTLGKKPDDMAGERGQISDLFCHQQDTDADATWVVGPSGLPSLVPADATLTDIAKISHLAKTLRVWQGNVPATVDFLKPDGSLLLKAKSDNPLDGAISFFAS